MGTTKKAVYKVHNGVDFDKIHFETSEDMLVTENKINDIQWSSGITVVEGTLHKIGKLCFLSGIFQKTATSNSLVFSEVVGILPVGYRPKVQANGTGNVVRIEGASNDSVVYPTSIIAANNGNIFAYKGKMVESITAFNSVRVNMFWEVA